MLMNDFDKTFVLAFYIFFFLKIELNCVKENKLIFTTCSFHKNMLSNLASVDLLIDKMCS